ncbi:MAG: hypothetical protein ABEJ27_03690 [Halodesulfurarchaeum sp.]
MAVTDARMGIRHLTVVPTNFDPPEEDEELEDIDLEDLEPDA